jgi:hypothetical protein
MNRLTELPWRALHPRDAASLLAGIDVPWWIAGGWALEMFRGTGPRPHTDLDVGVLRRDISTVLDHLSGWEIFEAKGGRLTRLAAGALPGLDVYSLWSRPTSADLWAIELMLNEADGDVLVYRRDPRIRRSLATAIWQSADRIYYLAPELQLLYKSSGTRERDDADFAQTWPLLSDGAREWLRNSLELVAPRHRWIESLKSSDGVARYSSTLLSQETAASTPHSFKTR